jgi:hypothetical protein
LRLHRCAVTVRAARDTANMELSLSIVERDGRFKLTSSANGK